MDEADGRSHGPHGFPACTAIEGVTAATGESDAEATDATLRDRWYGPRT
jgi:hypothetical protein